MPVTRKTNYTTKALTFVPALSETEREDEYFIESLKEEVNSIRQLPQSRIRYLFNASIMKIENLRRKLPFLSRSKKSLISELQREVQALKSEVEITKSNYNELKDLMFDYFYPKHWSSESSKQDGFVLPKINVKTLSENINQENRILILAYDADEGSLEEIVKSDLSNINLAIFNKERVDNIGDRNKNIIFHHPIEFLRRSRSEKQKYDQIFIIDLIEHLHPKDLSELFALLHYALKPGRKISVNVLDTESTEFAKKYLSDITVVRSYSIASIAQLAQKVGFKRSERVSQSGPAESFDINLLLYK